MRLFSAILLFASAAAAQGMHPGTRAGDFDLEDLSGARVSSAALRGPVTVVAFISAQCPISNSFNDRLSALYTEYAGKGVHFIFINSNANESSAEVAAHRKSAGFPFAV